MLSVALDLGTEILNWTLMILNKVMNIVSGSSLSSK
ncbi:hypothetical protein CCASP_08010 [Corynebacterium caspium DSM 44850]|nr:hypothetical protein CCASP_08010 [Corynebacterium caspium DSM 44850]